MQVESQSVGPSGPVAGQKEIAVFDEDRGKVLKAHCIQSTHCSGRNQNKSDTFPFPGT